MVEVERGVLIIGLSNTILFGGEQSSELILLNVATGQDFSLPLTPEQEVYLLEHVSIQNMLNIPEQEEVSSEEAAPSDEARERLNGILKGEKSDAEEHEDAWTGTEAASQF